MTDLENKEAFEKWLIKEFKLKKYDYALHFVDGEYQCTPTQARWQAWNASTQRQGFKLAPLEPTEEMIDCIYNEDGNYIDSIDGSPESIFKAMIDAV